MSNENQKMDQSTGLEALASMMKLFFGGGGSTQTQQGGTTTQTTSNALAPDVIAQFLKQALESNSGLVSTLQGQKSAGLYNSSTNRLLANDLLARMSAQAATNASQIGGKTVTQTSTPSTTKTTSSGLLGNQDMLGKLMLGLTAYQKLGGKEMTKELKDLMSGLTSSSAGAAGAFPGVDTAMLTDTGASTPLGLDYGTVSATPGESNLQYGGGISYTPSAAVNMEVPTLADSAGYGDILASDFGGFTSEQVGTAPSADQFYIPTEEEFANFSQASANNTGSTGATSSNAGQSANASAFSNATGTINLNTTGSAAYSLYSGLGQLTDSSSKNDVAGVANTAQGVQGAYNTYEQYQSAAKMAEIANQTNAAEGVSSAYTASDYMNYTGGFEAGSGSALGYIGPIMQAAYAQNNPKGAQNPDYRPAVGSAILTYFGAGWASPIVHSVAEPVLNAAMDAGTDSMGTFGAVLADPVGAPLSGQYEIGDLVSSTLDPANVFGGNPGGSTGSVVGAGVDPVGAALGDTGVFSGVKDTVDTLETSDPVGNAIGGLFGQGDDGGGLPGPGKVICTELAMNDKLDPELYKKAISPELVMKGQMLLGYHIIGVRLVEMMRKSEKLSDFLAPYVADYIRHKAGKKNRRGFIVKAFLHPISWILGFFNTDPNYYKVLYPYRRNRKVSVSI